MWPSKEQIYLLKAALLSSQEALEKWRALVDFDQIDPASFNLLPLIAKADLDPHPSLEKCRGVYRQTWVNNTLHWSKTLPILYELQKAGIDKIVLLKGMALVLCHYKDFGLRVMGDVDILVKQEHLARVLAVLKRHHFTSSPPYINLDQQEQYIRWHSLGFSNQDVRLDIHWSLIHENNALLDASVLENAKPLENYPFFVPCHTDLLLQVCLHGTKTSKVPLIRWIADALTLLKQDIDFGRLLMLAQKAHLSLSLYSALNFLVEEFDAPIPKDTLQQLQSHKAVRLERLEHKHQKLGHKLLAAWYRYRLNTGSSNLLHFLKITAGLKHSFQIPCFILKRLYTKMRSET